MNNKNYIVSIDAGTSRIKVVLFDEEGNEVDLVSDDSRIYKGNNGLAEQDMNELWDITAKCIRTLITKSGIKVNNLKAAVVSGQGEGCWIVDKDGKPINRAILWNDSRAVGIVNRIREDKDFYNEIKLLTGSYPKSGSTIVLLKWYKENHPDQYDKIKYCFSCKDWLRYKLTSEFYCDITDASTSYIDIRKKEYSEEIFKMMGIAGAEKIFPQLIMPGDIAGYVTGKASEETMLPEGICVAGGMLDIVSTSVGSGAINVGDVCTILGTSCINEITTNKYVFEENMTGWERHFVDDLFINVAGAMAGTPNIDWGLKNIMGIDQLDQDYLSALEVKLLEIPVGSNGLIYHPYISLSGERAPFFNPYAAGQLSGFNTATTKYEIMNSIYEGIALSAKDCLSNFTEQGLMFLSGGGSRSCFWAQMIADCVGREVVIGEGREFSAKGGAIAASIACGLFKNINEAVKVFCRVKHRFEPDMKKVKQYDEIYSMYKKMRIQSDSFWEWRHDYLKNNLN